MKAMRSNYNFCHVPHFYAYINHNCHIGIWPYNKFHATCTEDNFIFFYSIFAARNVISLHIWSYTTHTYNHDDDLLFVWFGTFITWYNHGRHPTHEKPALSHMHDHILVPILWSIDTKSAFIINKYHLSTELMFSFSALLKIWLLSIANT